MFTFWSVVCFVCKYIEDRDFSAHYFLKIKIGSFASCDLVCSLEMLRFKVLVQCAIRLHLLENINVGQVRVLQRGMYDVMLRLLYMSHFLLR